MRPARYKGDRDSIFNLDSIAEVHGEAMMDGTMRYLVKKHKLLGDYPYCKMEAARNGRFKSYTEATFSDYSHSPRDYIWVPARDLDFNTSNSSMKHVLNKLEE